MRLALFFFLLCILCACNQRPPEEHSVKENNGEYVPVSELKLHEASELAKVMRLMEKHADQSQAAIKAGEQLPPFPEGVEALLTATPTVGMRIDPQSYPAFAGHYIERLQALYAAGPEERAEEHDALVLSCANCHQVHCPGPLVKINKMYVGPLE